MKRREFLRLGVSYSTLSFLLPAWWHSTAFSDSKPLTAKSILNPGQPTTIANYCVKPPSKECPDWKAKPGHCDTCMFYNVDKSEATYKGGKFARCQLLADPSKPQFVSAKGWCSSYVKKA